MSIPAGNKNAATVFDAANEIEELIRLADASGLSDKALDDIVHDLASGIGTEVNNGGVASQITFIVKQLGPGGREVVMSLLPPND